MSVAEWLGWARSLLDSLGLTGLIVASFVVILAAAVIRNIVGSNK